MRITDLLSITELSRLTGKTRPTLYKYIGDYENNNYDNVPYSFKTLFDMITIENKSLNEVKDFCNKKFKGNEDDKASELVDLILKNKKKLDIDGMIKRIKEEL